MPKRAAGAEQLGQQKQVEKGKVEKVRTFVENVIRLGTDHAHDPKNRQSISWLCAPEQIWGMKGNRKMKKLMFGMAAALALCGMADIESKNVVGYTTKAVKGDMYYLVSAPFLSVGGNAESVSIEQVFSTTGIDAVAYDDMYDSGAEIMMRDPDTGVYTSYFYISDALDAEGTEVTAWADEEDGNALEGNAILKLGRGFWLRTPNSIGADAAITVAGEVSEVEKFTVTFAAGYQILANPFPVDTDLSKVETTGLTAVAYDDMYDSGAEIMVRDFTTGVYTSYFYLSDALNEDDEEVTGWADEEEGAVATGSVIPAGASFWMNSPAAGSLSFTK